MTDDTARSDARVRAEENAVRQLGDAIGYGRVMQLAGQLWGEALVSRGHPPGGEFAIGPCVAFVVPCRCTEDRGDADEHCDWCCGAGRVTERVRAAMDVARGWRKEPPTVEEVRACPWWWHRAPSIEPHVLWLDVDEDAAREHRVVVRVPRVLGHSVALAPWAGADAEWAPCLPPEGMP